VASIVFPAPECLKQAETETIMSLRTAFTIVAALLTALAAAFGLWAATMIPIRDDLDQFIIQIEQQSRWAAWAAFFNTLAAIVFVVLAFVDSRRAPRA
jgi:hypothetical protein